MYRIIVIKMKDALFILLFLIGSISFSQEAFFLKEKDTLYIVFDNPDTNNHVVKLYNNIEKDDGKTVVGLSSIYFLLDSTSIQKRKEFYKRREAHSNSNFGAIGASSSCDWCFGLYFVHKSVKLNYVRQSHTLDPIYINFKKRHLEKENVSLKDTLDFDKLVYNMIYYRYHPPISTLQLSEKELKEKKVFYYDGSTEKYNELKEILKEPHYIFMLDKTWSNPGFNNLPRSEYYIFNEVRYKSSRKLIPD
ncbi:hypothetical protein D778_01546 [Xanthomarina gelatinilytica]|uniref:Uncharacterized protein n=2 Tax=Xanthomarina gelatinilytica TaxID=1137281 RepID=M7MKQ1_9FLAO|nr:hypothetical protein D778_01546 [Xanthomarina gelatinilytica]